MVKKWWLSSLDSSALELDVEGSRWYDGYHAIPKPESMRISNGLVNEISTRLEELLNKECKRYHIIKKKNITPDDKWMNEVIQSGTLSDKVAALALKVSASPLHELDTLDILIAMASRKEQRVSQLALDALKDLLIHNLLPDRKLIPFKSQDLTHESMTVNCGLLMWFEDKLVERVGKIIDCLDYGLKSTVDYFKKFCMNICLELLSSKSEQELRLLIMLINKFGDNVGGACAKTSQLLKNLLTVHSAMKGVVVREINEFISRPHLSHKAVYNAVTFLNQIYLNYNDSKVAEALIETYINLFEKNINTSTKTITSTVESTSKKDKKTIKSGNKNAKKADTSLNKEESSSRLLAALLNGINRAYPYLQSKKGLEKHMDTLFRIVHVASFSAATQALLLISFIAIGEQSINTKDGEVHKKKRNKKISLIASDDVESSKAAEPESSIVSRYYRALYEKLQSDQVLSRGRNSVFLGLLYRSMMSDSSDQRSTAFVKRIGSLVSHAAAPIAAGLLLLISEVCSARPVVVGMLSRVEESISSAPSSSSSSFSVDEVYSQLGSFNAVKREPEFACVSAPSLWEMALLQTHFHPSVAAFASSLLADQHHIKFDGDPIVEFSLASFLSRFSYKNAKASKSSKIKSRVVNEDAINSSEFITSRNVPPHKTFFHKFFGTRAQMVEKGLIKQKIKKKSKGAVDDEDEEMDRFADKLAQDLMTSAGGGDPDIDDIDFDDDDIMDDAAAAADDDDDDDDDGDDDRGGGDLTEFDDNDEIDDFDVDGNDYSESDGEGKGDEAYELTPFGDEYGDDDFDGHAKAFESTVQAVKKEKKKGVVGDSHIGKKRKGDSDFADASEYEDIMEQIVQFHKNNPDFGGLEETSSNNARKGGKKKAR